jgi:hypothetical protein
MRAASNLRPGRQGVTLRDLAEIAASVGTGSLAELGSGLAYLGALPFGGDAAAQHVKRAVQDAYTYQPRGEGAQRILGQVAQAIDPYAQAAAQGTQQFADAAYQATGSPLVGALAQVAPQAIMEVADRANIGSLNRGRSSIGISAKDAAKKTAEESLGMSPDRAMAILGGWEVRKAGGANEPFPFNDQQMAALDAYNAVKNPSSKYLFHTTTPDRLESIKETGLIPGSKPRHEGVSGSNAVSLAANEAIARYYGAPDDVMIRVSKKYKPEGLEADLLAGEGAYIYRNTLPPDALEVFNGKKWVPLK